MTKQDYLEMYKFHYEANKKLENEFDLFDRILNQEINERIEKNNKAMEHARQLLRSYYKTYMEDIITYCEAA